MTRLRNLLGLSLCLITVVLLLAPVSSAQVWDKKTTITINQPWQIPGKVTLPAGTYVFRLYDSLSHRHIVEVFSAEEDKHYATVIGIPAYRLEATDETVLDFYERRTPGPAAVQYWFYPASNFGVEFARPGFLATELAQVTPTEPVEEAAPPPEPPVEQAAPSLEPEPAETVEAEPTAPISEPVVSEPAPEKAVEVVEEPPVQTPAELPRTASNLPLIALLGLLSLGAGIGLHVE